MKTATKKKKSFNPETNPYYAHFLKHNPFVSAAMACFGEAAWDAAIEQAMVVIDDSSNIIEVRTGLAAIKSSNQRKAR